MDCKLEFGFEEAKGEQMNKNKLYREKHESIYIYIYRKQQVKWQD